uniref:Serine protease family S33 putative n=1 Tax=Albugo laibachii Nc14 TaxID=890382 RepID=F0W609_9STRA|nr:serine protease family S33 putative [Albugo laibachii Nc14]|eukprot:CCA16551.1 serine protease family S33 putative [Albugo laibachii Nc14]
MKIRSTTTGNIKLSTMSQYATQRTMRALMYRQVHRWIITLGRRLPAAVFFSFLVKYIIPHVTQTLLLLHLHRTKERPKLYHQPRRRLQQLVASCPSLETYHPQWYTFNGHLHTIFVAFQDFWPFSAQPYKRELVEFPDGGISAIDWALPTNSKSLIDPTIPTMLILPGFTGTSQSVYIRSLVQIMLSNGWQLGILLARGSDNLALKTPQISSLGYTNDLCHTIAFISKKYHFDENPHRILVGCGFSMGANLLTKYLGEQKNDTPLTGAISVGNPFDLLHCCDKMHLDPFNRLVYSRILAKNFKDVMQKCNAYKLLATIQNVDICRLKASTTLMQMDEYLTRHAFGFETVHDYYRDSSSARLLKHIRIPLFCISARDDPICASEAIPYAECLANPNIILCTTKSGGHLGFYEVKQPKSDGRWVNRVILEFSQSLAVN